MTVATAEENTPWAAPVYYVYQEGGFYFFSDPRSRHIVESQASGRSAASVHVAANTWKDIRGLQMSGHIRRVSIGPESARALAAYLKKFPFTSEFFSSGAPLKVEDFKQRFNVRLYAFIPERVYYLDNRVRFGFREKVDL
ncbi:MAG: pyridoxamine 5'-phosphate oxidase family protein [Deltaproteobacteria bacterium]|nr:pyridoxamine 5'-phosphate oxidase family protein [Deltaproteobacteria bacterium]